MQQNFIELKRQYHQTQTFIKVQQYIQDSLLLIDIVQYYYLLLLITHFYAIMSRSNYAIYLGITNIVRIVFIFLLRLHRREIQNEDYQLSTIYKYHYSDNLRQYSVDELDKYLEETITLFTFLIGRMLTIIFILISIYDCASSTYFFYNSWYSKEELIDHVLTLLPSYMLFTMIALFIVLMTPVVIAWPLYKLFEYCHAHQYFVQNIRTILQTNEDRPQVLVEDNNNQINIDNRICPICMIELVHNDAISKLGCSRQHCFHLKCISSWLQTNTTCRICRAEV